MSYNSDLPVITRSSGLSCRLFGYFVKRSFGEIINKKCYYFISLASCFLAIYIALVANTIISQAPLIFLKIGEIENGEIDVFLEPAQMSIDRYLNMSKVDILIKHEFGSLAPRLFFGCAINKIGYETINLNLTSIDTERERTQRIGTKYDLPVLKEGECAIHKSLSDYHHIKEGDRIELRIFIKEYLDILYEIYKPKGPPLNLRNIIASCEISHILNDLGGKVARDYEDTTVLMELKYFDKFLAKQLDMLPSDFREFLTNFNPHYVVSMILANHPNRGYVYSDSDGYRIQGTIAAYVDSIVTKLGYYPVKANMPILKNIILFNMGVMFLSIILNLIVIVLAAISTFLIYSLLTISVESRTFEFGLMRMLGTGKLGLTVLVLVQAVMFVLPAFTLAILLSYPGLSFASHLTEENFGLSFSAVPSFYAVIWAIGIGIFVPLIAAILPIKEVLTRNLVESLDVSRSKSRGVHITIEYEKKSSTWTTFGFGIIVILYGLSIYYLLPLSIMAMNAELMLWIMLSILLTIVIGLIMLSLNITHLIERALVFIFLFYESSAMKFLVLKNMVAHKLRNRRTIIIYALSLSFLLLTITAYTTELRNIEMTMQSKFPSKLDVSWPHGWPTYPIIAKIEALLEELKDEVEDFGWMSETLASHYRGRFKKTWVTDYGRQVYLKIKHSAITPNYFSVAEEGLFELSTKNKTSGLRLGEQLYTPRGTQGVGIGSFIEGLIKVDVEDPKTTFLLYYEKDTTTLLFDSRPIFTLDSCPGLMMTYNDYMGILAQDVIMSIPLFMKVANISSLSSIRWKHLVIKIKDDDIKSYGKVVKELRRNLSSDDISIWNYYQGIDQIESIKYLLDLIFIFIIILFMFLSFFSLSSSMTANILDQSKEIAIVRSIGLNKTRTMLMHVYEAFILVLTGSVTGAFIGMIIAYTLSIQRMLYSSLPIHFEFPYVHLLTMIVTSLICALLSTISPSLYLLKKPISELARM